MLRVIFSTALLSIVLNSYGQILFTPIGGALAPSYASGSQSQAIEYADFNLDGKIDLAIANTNGNNVSVLIGNGNGVFVNAVALGSGVAPLDVVCGDFNNDGNSDIAVPSYISGWIRIYSGQGNGSFVFVGTYTCGASPRQIVTSDFNLDGNLDLAVVNEPNKINVLLGNGNGTFQSSLNFISVSGPSDLIATDLNGDNKPDLLATGTSSNTLLIHFGIGDGTFQLPTSVSFADSPISLEVGDLNQDGFKDIVINTGIRYYVMINNGNSTFQPSSETNVPLNQRYSVRKIKVKDINNDTKMDLIFLNGANSNVTILPGNGDGTFQSELFYGVGNAYPLDIQLADFNGDANLDIVTVTDQSIGSGAVSVLIGNGDATFQSVRNFLPRAHDIYDGNNLLQKDINNDSYSDLIASNGAGIYTLLSNGDGTFQTPVIYQTNQNGSLISGFTIEDFNKDSYWDIAVSYSNKAKVSLFLGTSTSIFQSQIDIITSGSISAITCSDFNNDGNKDIVGSSSPYIYFLPGNGNGTFNSSTSIYAGSSRTYHIAHADVNNDGNEDLFLPSGHGDGSSDEMIALLGNGDGTFALPVYYYLGPNNPVFLATADFNKDGKSDFAVALGMGGVSIFISKGDGTFFPKNSYWGGNAPFSLAIEDYNGDGNDDIAIASYNSEKISILPGKGDGTFDLLQQIRVIANPADVVAGDFNGDKKMDIAAIGNSIAILINNSNTSVAPLLKTQALCAGTTINIPYSATGIFSASNTFTAQLSDSSGSFVSAIPISSSVTSNVSGVLSATIPSSTIVGNHYRIRVVSTDAVVIFDNGKNISINTSLPNQPTSFITNDSSCHGTVTYTLANIVGNNYSWLLSGGGTLTTNGNSILVNWTANGGPYTLTCIPSNGCGTGPSLSESVTVVDVPTQPSSIIHPTYHCLNTIESYSVSLDNAATSYTWQLPIGWTGSSSSSSIAVTAAYTYGSIEVKANNACGASSASIFYPGYPSMVAKPFITTSGNILTSSGSNVSFQWKLDGVTAGTNTSTFNALIEGDYSVTVTDLTTGCQNTSDVLYFIPESVPTNNIEEDKLMYTKIYPNPCLGKLHLEGEINKPMDVIVESISGIQIYKERLGNGLNGITNVIDLSSLYKGVYVLVLKSDEDIIWKKIILE